LEKQISIIIGDITRQETEAIVNAANTSLLGGGGVDGAIHRAAGKELLEECKTLNGCPTGEAKISKGYNLKAKYVIHTVGPVWNGGKYGEKEKLASCYKNSLALAEKNKIRSISFPSISTGVYRFPVAEASKIALKEIKDFLKQKSTIEKVVIVCFDEKTFEAYVRANKNN
jgi:O-acetyl-ADP-ribose deacetylase